MKKIFALALALMLALTSGAWAVSIDTIDVRNCYVGRTYGPNVPDAVKTPVYMEASNIEYFNPNHVFWTAFDTSTYHMPPSLYEDYYVSHCRFYGTPTQAGVYHMKVIIEVDDYYYEEEYYDSSYFDLTIYPAVPQITTTSPNDGVEGENYSYELKADVYSNDISGLTWEKVSGDLPGGLSLDKSTGIISGIPEEAGDFKFIVKAVNTFTENEVNLTTDSDTQELTITITASSEETGYGTGDNSEEGSSGENDGTGEGSGEAGGNSETGDGTAGTEGTAGNESEEGIGNTGNTGNTGGGTSGSSGGGGCNSFGTLGVMLLALMAFRKR